MSFSIVKLITRHDSDINGLNSFGFRQYFESYILRIKSDKSTNATIMSPTDAIKFKGDLGGWLHTQYIASDYHWIVSRINGYLDPTCFVGDKLSILIPSVNLIDELLTKYKNSVS
jgi:hypothetical protein